MSISVSIIIPTYNRCTKLKKTIESVLAQTYKDFELLICDDGSTDGTKEMVKSFIDSRIVWIEGENSGGPAIPRNRGIKHSSTNWLAFLDSDDLWLPTKLEEQVLIIEKYNLLAVCTNAKILRDKEYLEDLYFQKSKNKYLTFTDLLNLNLVICSSILIHKNIVTRVGGFPESHKFKAIEDYALWLSSSMLTDIYYISKPLTIYRDEGGDSIRSEVKENELIKHNRIIVETFLRAQKIDNTLFFQIKLLTTYCKNMIKVLLIKPIFFIKLSIKRYFDDK